MYFLLHLQAGHGDAFVLLTICFQEDDASLCSGCIPAHGVNTFVVVTD
jgi:hypothetical protein